ncbi:MAG: YHS domain-containing protein [Candidatus Kapabacteria bacterium]|jgi:YHS domain-containing protein|nr:YHS domain-containing protein [Candidatus Kapabacteria bacterium]
MKTSYWSASRLTVGVIAFLVAAMNLQAQSVFADNKGIAVKGYDVVAYFSENKPMQGKSEFAHEWNGATWHFSSAQHRDLFKAAPEKYAPQYGGFCAFGVCMKNAKYPTDPLAWKIVEGKLYLNYNLQTQTAWEKEPLSGTIAKGDKAWKTLATSNK